MKNKMRYYLAVAAVVIAAVIGVDKGTLSVLIREAVQMGEYAAEEERQESRLEREESADGTDGNLDGGDGELDPLAVTYIDVGQGDSILLQCGGHNMLIDAGKNDQGTKLQDYFMSKGIEKFDYLVGTHPDEDHIGGLDVIITKFPADHVLMPDIEADTRTYDDVILALEYRSMEAEHPEQGDEFLLGDAAVTVVGPPDKDYDDKNNYSIMLMVQHGSQKFLFAGDGEKEEELDILKSGMDVEADVLKAGHHGSSTSSSQKFLDAVSPEAVVISCGEDNSYGHPHQETMIKLRSMGVDVYRTDKEGTIVAESDGSSITFNVPPSEW